MPIDGLYSEAKPDQIVSGKIANTPANANASLWVTIPSFDDPNARWGPVTWSPHGTTMPQAGAACLIGFDENRIPWLLSFAGPWS